MIETDPENLIYVGAPNEAVTVTVGKTGTFHLVNFTLDGDTQTLTEGEPIEFSLKPSGDATILQFHFMFSNPTGGKYVVAVSQVEDLPNNESLHGFKQQGSIPVIIDYTFFAE